jgi:hypothetical protein
MEQYSARSEICANFSVSKISVGNGFCLVSKETADNSVLSVLVRVDINTESRFAYIIPFLTRSRGEYNMSSSQLKLIVTMLLEYRF